MTRSLFDLTGKRALITGSSQGIGLALAQGLAAAGARVVLNGRDTAKLAAAAATIPGAETLAFDATDHAAVRAAVDGFEATHGAIDILVNNAGMQHRTPLEDFPPEAFERLLQTNIATVFNVGQAVARHMIARRRGQDHQHLLGADRPRPPRHRALYRHQGRRRQPDQGHGDRLGADTGCNATPSRRAISTRR